MNCTGVSLFPRPGWGKQRPGGASQGDGREGGGKGGLPFHLRSPISPPKLSAVRPGLTASHQTALPWPPPQDLLPRDRLCLGKIERADGAGRLPYPSPPRRVVLRGHCRGHAGQCATALSAQQPPDGLLTGGVKACSTHPNTPHFAAPTPAPCISQHPSLVFCGTLSSPLHFSRCPGAGGSLGSGIEGITLMHRRGLVWAHSGLWAQLWQLAPCMGLEVSGSRAIVYLLTHGL